jgi:hypothetical protein
MERVVRFLAVMLHGQCDGRFASTATAIGVISLRNWWVDASRETPFALPGSGPDFLR